MKNVVGAALAAAMTAVLALGAAAQVDEDQDGGFGQADAATLGVEPVNVDGWCEADAGTLGYPNPASACK